MKPLKLAVINIVIVCCLTISLNTPAQNARLSEIKPKITQPKFKKVLPGTRVVETQEYRVSGALAAKVAIANGFHFYPDKKIHNLGPSNIMAGAYFDSTLPQNQGNGSSQMIDGQFMVVGKCASLASAPNPSIKCWNIFHLFKGKKLNKFWRIKNIEISNVNGWLKKPNINTDDPYTKIRVTKPSSQVEPTKAQINYVTFIGPKNAKWKDAFSR